MEHNLIVKRKININSGNGLIKFKEIKGRVIKFLPVLTGLDITSSIAIVHNFEDNKIYNIIFDSYHEPLEIVTEVIKKTPDVNSKKKKECPNCQGWGLTIDEYNGDTPIRCFNCDGKGFIVEVKS